MKKIFLILALGLGFTFVLNSCKDDDDNNYTDYDTIGLTLEYANADFIYDEKNDEFYFRVYFYDEYVVLLPGDVVLTYLEVGWDAEEQLPLWGQIGLVPFATGYREGNKDHVMNINSIYTKKYFEVIAWDDVQNPVALNGIGIKVIVIPGNIINSRTNSNLDFSDYKAVIKHYNIDESKTKRIENKRSIERLD